MRRREFMQIEGRTFYGAWVIAPELNGYDIPIAIGAGGGSYAGTWVMTE
jgi:hypothetical protein